MKKAILAIMVLGLCFGLANAAMALDTDSTNVTVTVNEVETLEAPADVTITMDYTPGETEYDVTILPRLKSNITYIHNVGVNQKIVATSSADAGNAPNTIDITVVVDDGEANPGPIVTNGAGNTVGLDLWKNLAGGTHTSTVTWSASATIAGTQAGEYAFTVTFTAADDT